MSGTNQEIEGNNGVDTAGLTTNTVPKATASDTIGDSNITDDGTTVTVNSAFYATNGSAEVSVQGTSAYMSADQQSNTNIESNLLGNEFTHNVKNTFNAPANYFPQLTASQIVETDASKNLVSVAKGTAYNKDFGTGTANIAEIGSTLGNTKPLITSSSGKLQTSDLVDITSSCTILGWISFSVKKIKAIDMGNYYIVNGEVVGTSNSSTTQVVLPFTNNGVQLDDCRFAINNGTNIFARCFVGAGSNTVDFRATVAGSTFSSTGTKAVYFTVIIEK